MRFQDQGTSFNLLEIMNLKSYLTKLLNAIEDLANSNTFSLAKGSDLAIADGKLYSFIPRFEKFEQVIGCLNETLSYNIFNDLINSGKLHKLTKEETSVFANFLFPTH